MSAALPSTANSTTRYRRLWVVARIGRYGAVLLVVTLIAMLFAAITFDWKPSGRVAVALETLVALLLLSAVISEGISFFLGLGKPRCPLCGGFIKDTRRFARSAAAPRKCASCGADLLAARAPPNDRLELQRHEQSARGSARGASQPER